LHGIDESLPFIAVNLAVLTISDTRDSESDTSGQCLVDRIEAAGHRLVERAIVRDDVDEIRAQVLHWLARPDVDVIVTTGGTGLAVRDVTPEALMPLFEKQIEGFAILFHQASYESVGLSTVQSRACAGLAKGTFIFCLPGSNGAVRDGWDRIIKGQLDARHRPCNLVELMPRLRERLNG
jgi:molybdenum cofactor biosynthesis protein B